MLDRTTHAIGAHQEARKVFEVVLRSLEENLGVDFGCICLYQSESRRVTVTCVGERSLALARAIGLDERAQVEPEGVLLATCLHGELVYEASIDEKSAPFLKLLAGGGLRALVSAPLRIENNEVFGVLLVANRSADSFSSDDREFLRQLSSHVALATHQARLYDALEASYQDLRQTQQTVMQHERLRARSARSRAASRMTSTTRSRPQRCTRSRCSRTNVA